MEKSYELADHLLSKTPHLATTKRIEKLAQWLEDAAAAWIDEEEANYEPPDPPGWEGGFAENH